VSADDLLAPDEPPAFEVINPAAPASAVLLCDHASRRIPRALGTLGLSEAQLRDHIAWDIGAAVVARAAAAALDAPLVLSGYSRLVIDCNRPLVAASSVPERTGGVDVPGNAGITDAARAVRARACFWPYHHAIEELLRRREAAGRRSAILSIHSFTPAPLAGPRPWHAAMVYGRDRSLAGLLLDALTRDGALVLGDNEPYRVTDAGDYGIPVYAERAGRPGVLIEVRQDQLADDAAAAGWGRRLAEAYRQVEPALFARE
jgi:predicted N-formylglutamate amidohydrolase